VLGFAHHAGCGDRLSSVCAPGSEIVGQNAPPYPSHHAAGDDRRPSARHAGGVSISAPAADRLQDLRAGPALTLRKTGNTPGVGPLTASPISYPYFRCNHPAATPAEPALAGSSAASRCSVAGLGPRQLRNDSRDAGICKERSRADMLLNAVASAASAGRPDTGTSKL